MEKELQLVIFTLDEQRFGLHLGTVERVFRSVEITTVPNAPEIVMGVINVAGRVIPVINLRRRFSLAAKEVGLDSQFMVVGLNSRRVVLVVDKVKGVFTFPGQEVVPLDRIFFDMEYVEGLVQLGDDLIILNDLQLLLSAEEKRFLQQGGKGGQDPGPRKGAKTKRAKSRQG